MNDYLALFGYNQGTTPSSATTSTTPSTPSTSSGVQGIINQNINQYQSGGGGGGGIQGLDPYSSPQGNSLNSLTKTKFGYNNALGRTIQGVKDFSSSVVDKFSGLPGVEQGKSLISNIMDNTLVGRMAAMRNPLNPKASNYNPSLQGQIDMLEDMTGTRVFGTSDNLQFEDAAMIGRDPNSGLAKYGPGSVLSGQNVVSGFGTNDYIGQLDKYIEKMKTYATLSKFQQAKLDRAIAEKKAAEEKAMLEELAREEERARVAGVQKDLDTGSYVDRDTSGMTASDRAVGGGAGVAGLGPSAEDRGSRSAQGYSQHAKGGRVGFKKGGLATMFKLKG
jgi:hypothetical protein